MTEVKYTTNLCSTYVERAKSQVQMDSRVEALFDVFDMMLYAKTKEFLKTSSESPENCKEVPADKGDGPGIPKLNYDSVKANDEFTLFAKQSVDALNQKRNTGFKPYRVQCRYTSSGCKAYFSKGSSEETSHIRICPFRPVPCLLGSVCRDVVSFGYFTNHLQSHFMEPVIGNQLTTLVYLRKEDFATDQVYVPKWIIVNEKHFFLMLSHKVSGTWLSWVWMLGSQEEAKDYWYSIAIGKGTKVISSSKSQVQSIRTPIDHIEAQGICIKFRDETLKDVCGISKNVVLSEFVVDLEICSFKSYAQQSKTSSSI